MIVIMSCASIFAETASTAEEGGILAPVSISEVWPPSQDAYQRDQTMLNFMIAFECVVTVLSVVEMLIRIWVCNVSPLYPLQYDDVMNRRCGGCRRCPICPSATPAVKVDAAGTAGSGRNLLGSALARAAGPAQRRASLLQRAASDSELPADGEAAVPVGSDDPVRVLTEEYRRNYRLKRKKARVMFLLSRSLQMDLASTAPTLLWMLTAGSFDAFGMGFWASMGRALRLMRLLRFQRYMQGFRLLVTVARERATELMTGFCMSFILVFVLATALFYVEYQVNEGIKSLFSACYLLIISLSTVGYGDVTPMTTAGRLIIGSGALLGIALFTLPSSVIASAYTDRLARVAKSRELGLQTFSDVHRRVLLRLAMAKWFRSSQRLRAQEMAQYRKQAEQRLFGESSSPQTAEIAESDFSDSASGFIPCQAPIKPMSSARREMLIQQEAEALRPAVTITDRRRIEKALALLRACDNNVSTALDLISDVLATTAHM